jgi:cell division protein ZapB
MELELFGALEKKVEDLIGLCTALKLENMRISEENRRIQEERGGFKDRIDAILKKLEGI